MLLRSAASACTGPRGVVLLGYPAARQLGGECPLTDLCQCGWPQAPHRTRATNREESVPLAHLAGRVDQGQRTDSEHVSCRRDHHNRRSEKTESTTKLRIQRPVWRALLYHLSCTARAVEHAIRGAPWR